MGEALPLRSTTAQPSWERARILSDVRRANACWRKLWLSKGHHLSSNNAENVSTSIQWNRVRRSGAHTYSVRTALDFPQLRISFHI